MWLYSCHMKTMTAKSYTTISLTKHQYAGNRLANQRIISSKENCSADILEHKDLRAAATTSRRLSLHRESLWDVLMLRKYRLSRKGRQGKFECECKRRQCRSSSVCYVEKITYKFVRTIAFIVSGGNLLRIMLLSLIKILTQNIHNSQASHCRHQPIRHKSMPSKQSAYLLSTTLSMMLLINLTALQQVHGTEHIGGGSSNSNNNNNSSSSSSSNSGSNSSSSGDINRRLENIGKTQQLMRDHSNTTTNISSMLSENPNQEKRTWDSGMPSDINLKDVTNNRSVGSTVQSKYSSDSQSNQSLTTTKEIPVGGNPLPRHEILQAYSMESHSNNKKRIFPNFLKNHTNHIMQKNINVNVNVSFVEDHLRNSKATITYPNSSVTTSDTFDNIINSRASENDDSFTCNSCQSRERAKLYTLESIKNQILKRLRLEKPPNISTPIQVPSKILEEFYKKLNATHANERRSQYYEQNHPLLQRRTPVPSYDYSADMQNDEADNQQGYALARDNLSIPEIDYNLYQDSDYFDETTSSFQHDEYYSRVNSIFLFPSKPRIRHNKKLEILNFTLEPKHLSITQTIFHVYVRGIDWLREHMPGIVERKQSNGTSILDDNIVLTVHRALRKQNAVNYSHSVKLIRTNVKIPSGLGTWINIEVKQLSTFWRNNPGKTQGIIIKGLEKWMRPLIVTGDTDEALTAHIEVKVKEKRRQKRSISFDCKESDNEKRCCRYPLKVNFTNFGWDFVIAPTSFDAYFCNGECNIGFNPKHTHTYVASLAISASPCCSPTKMSSLSLLHFTENQLLVLSTIPNMSVEQCSCL